MQKDLWNFTMTNDNADSDKVKQYSKSIQSIPSIPPCENGWHKVQAI